MMRKIVKINEEKCNGCGACAEACHEGAIKIINNKAKLIRDDYCDGLGDCLPACPMDAISFEEREAAEYDEEAVKLHLQNRNLAAHPNENSAELIEKGGSQLKQWPVKIKLIPVTAPYFKDAELLIAADCTAFAYADFHEQFIKKHITLIGCPKLDNVDYSEKLAEIIKNNDITKITVVRMEVPCCRGLEKAVDEALQKSGKTLPRETVVITTKGAVKETDENFCLHC